MSSKIIAVDFDGTLCENRFPDIGEPIMPIINNLLAEQENGSKIILWTCRTEELLKNAIKWCENFGIKFDAICDHTLESKQKYKNHSRKVFAHEYWDDRAVNVKHIIMASKNTGSTKCSKCVTEKYNCINCRDNPIYADVPRISMFSEYVPCCPQGYTDCVNDPGYIKYHYPDWYKDLYGDMTPEEAAKQDCCPENFNRCYDDEDK